MAPLYYSISHECAGTSVRKIMGRSKKVIIVVDETKPFAFAESDTNLNLVIGETKPYRGFLQVIDNIQQPGKSY